MNKTIFILCKSVVNGFFYKKNSFFFKCILTSLSLILICSCASFETEDYQKKAKIEANDYQKETNKDAKFENILKSFSNGKVFNINTSDYPSVGNKNAPVVIIEFFDFLCPYCKDVSEQLDQVVKDNPNNVRLIYANYPMDMECNSFVSRRMHRGACLLAKGAICAFEQNNFATYHKLVFDMDKRSINSDVLKRLATDANLNADKFQKCITSVFTETVLQLQLMEAMKLNLRGVPMIYINGREYKYSVNKEIIQKIIDKEIKKVK